MNQQVSSERTEFDNSSDSPLIITNTIWDQSAKIFAAVIENPSVLPDDADGSATTVGPDDHDKHYNTRNLKQTKTIKKAPMSLSALARLQEEHALWLR